MDSGTGMFYGVGFDPLDQAPAIIALVVGILVWRRHRRDRRARLFVAFMGTELLIAVLIGLFVWFYPASQDLESVAVSHPYDPPGDALMLFAAALSTVVYLHFGASFPHARPWLRARRVAVWYALPLPAALAYYAAAIRSGPSAIGSFGAEQTIVMVFGLMMVAAMVTAVVSVYRSYREMTEDERDRYRVPVLGVFVGMFASLAVEIVIAFLPFSGDNRYALWAENVLVTASGLLLPLFFFMAAVKYRLLEHHSQDYVAKL